tara:strand:+ start:3209 stop:4039 length:831 start_codon:yes stop_codon:yes gene_type:complete
MNNYTRKQSYFWFSLLAWLVGILFFFPVFWTIITSFKTEIQAISYPPIWFDFDWTLENYVAIKERSNYWRHCYNSAILALGSMLFGFLLAIPAAWSMAFVPTKYTRSILMWMLSTKMLPSVGVLIPVYLIFRNFQLLDTRIGLIIILTLINLPVIVWMLFTYFRDIPMEILDAARMDGANLWSEIYFVLVPMAFPGLISTALLVIILVWNESFWTLNLTTTNAAPLSALIASYSSPEGLFYAKLSAASTLAIIPIVILGWFSQKQIVRGLTFGAVK